jgi:uncharacterized protein YdhG (YjbR/CyaY superfamily)
MKLKKDVDEYITDAPKEIQVKLRKLRALIKEIAPKAEERMSYGMPYYEYKGRLVYFALMKRHIGLYIPPPIITEHKNELIKYGTSISAVRFPINEKLPYSLIKKLIKSRMKKNKAKKPD